MSEQLGHPSDEARSHPLVGGEAPTKESCDGCGAAERLLTPTHLGDYCPDCLHGMALSLEVTQEFTRRLRPSMLEAVKVMGEREAPEAIVQDMLEEEPGMVAREVFFEVFGTSS